MSETETFIFLFGIIVGFVGLFIFLFIMNYNSNRFKITYKDEVYSLYFKSNPFKKYRKVFESKYKRDCKAEAFRIKEELTETFT